MSIPIVATVSLTYRIVAFRNVFWLAGALQMHKILSCCLIEGNNAPRAPTVSPGMKTISHNLKTLMFKLKPSLA